MRSACTPVCLGHGEEGCCVNIPLFNWVSRQSDVEGQLAGNKNTILPFTRKQPQEQGEGMEEEEEEDGEEREETSNDVGETGKSEGRVEMGEGEVEKEETKTPKDDAPDLKQKANSLLYTTPHNTRYGLRNRAMPSSVWEPSPTKVKRQRTQPTDANATEAHKDISLDSGKAASQDSVVSSLVECTEDKESTGTSQENQAPTGASQAERESIFCSTPVQPSRSVVVGSCQLTPMQMLVAHLPNDEEEDLQGYLSQQVDSEASAEVPDICSEFNPTPFTPTLPHHKPLIPSPTHTHTHHTHTPSSLCLNIFCWECADLSLVTCCLSAKHLCLL